MTTILIGKTKEEVERDLLNNSSIFLTKAGGRLKLGGRTRKSRHAVYEEKPGSFGGYSSVPSRQP